MERPVTPSPGNASRTASSGGAENPPARYVGPLPLYNYIENLIMNFCLFILKKAGGGCGHF